MFRTLFSLAIAAAGWYYMFYSQAAARLEGIEDPVANSRRIRFRRLGGFSMLLLGIAFFAGFFAVDQENPTPAFFLIWLIVCLLVAVVLILGLVDVRLTWKLRQHQSAARSSSEERR